MGPDRAVWTLPARPFGSDLTALAEAFKLVFAERVVRKQRPCTVHVCGLAVKLMVRSTIVHFEFRGAEIDVSFDFTELVFL